MGNARKRGESRKQEAARWGQGSQADGGRRQRDKEGRVGRERPLDRSSSGVGQAMRVARCPGGEQTQEEETWNGVQPDSWVTKKQLASFSHEDGGGPAWELWCGAWGMTRHTC